MSTHSVSSVRNAIEVFFWEQVGWRRGMAELREQEPFDSFANANYAEWTELLIEYVAGLTEADETLQRLAAEPRLFSPDGKEFWPQGSPVGDGITKELATHCCPEGEAMDTDECKRWFQKRVGPL